MKTITNINYIKYKMSKRMNKKRKNPTMLKGIREGSFVEVELYNNRTYRGLVREIWYRDDIYEGNNCLDLVMGWSKYISVGDDNKIIIEKDIKSIKRIKPIKLEID